MEEKYLLYPADGDIDEDDGMTKLEILVMLAKELGYELSKKVERPKNKDVHWDLTVDGEFWYPSDMF